MTYYSVDCARRFVIVWASTVWGLDTTPEEERRYLLPLGGAVIFVNVFVVPRVRVSTHQDDFSSFQKF